MTKRKRDCRLPEEVIQIILSFLLPEKAAQFSVLSKTWLHAWSTYPDIDFRQDIICRKLPAGESNSKQDKEKFTKFVDDNLLRYSNHNLPINKFLLDLTVFDRKLASQLDKWLGMVVNMGVKHLVLHINPSRTRSYSLPPLIFASNQLASLTVRGSCTKSLLLPNKQKIIGFPLLSNSIINCCNLKKLFLHTVYLDDRIFQILCSSCPLIEQLSLNECWGLKNIQVSNLRKLWCLDVTTTRHQILDITEAPSLKDLSYSSSYGSCFVISISASQKLEYLSLSEWRAPVMSLHNLISQCPVLKYLCLYGCDALDKVDLSSQTLKCLSFYECDSLVEAKIDAPNLLFFVYVGDQIPSFSFKSLSEQFKSLIHIRPSYDLDTSFFIKIKDLLTKFNHCKTYLDVSVSSGNILFNIEDLREIPLLPQPKMHRLRIKSTSSPSSTYSALVNGLLWSCHPETLLVHLPIENDCQFVRFLCRELIDRRSQNCCSSDQVMCWRHYLNHVEVGSLQSVYSKLMPQPFDWKSLVDGSMIPRRILDICFTLNWIL